MIELLKDGKFIKVLEHTSNSPCVDPIGKKLIVARAIQNESQCLLRPVFFFIFFEVHVYDINDICM